MAMNAEPLIGPIFRRDGEIVWRWSWTLFLFDAENCLLPCWSFTSGPWPNRWNLPGPCRHLSL